jgi:FkbM family methyltransferase
MPILKNWIESGTDPLKFLLKHIYRPRIVIHAGSYIGEESDTYKSHGVEAIYWVEAQSEICSQLRENFGPEYVFEGAVYSKSDLEIEFHITNNGLSSSIYKINDNVWNIRNVSVEKVKTTTIDQILLSKTFSDSHFPDLLVLDLQGGELEAIQGAQKTIQRIPYLLIEVSKSAIYLGGAEYNELNLALSKIGFLPVRKFIDQLSGHGEVIYSNQKIGFIKKIQLAAIMRRTFISVYLNNIIRRVIQKYSLLISQTKQ